MRGLLAIAFLSVYLFYPSCSGADKPKDVASVDASDNSDLKEFVSLLELYARVQIDIRARGNILAEFVELSDAVRIRTRDAEECRRFRDRTRDLYLADDSQLLKRDLETLKHLEVSPAWGGLHTTFVYYLETSIEVEEEAPNFFGAFSYSDVSESLRPPTISVDVERMVEFKVKQSECNKAAIAWSEQWKNNQKIHGTKLKLPKTWDAYVIRVSKSVSKKKQ